MLPLIKAVHDWYPLTAIITNPTPILRAKILKSQITKWAESSNIDILKPTTLRNNLKEPKIESIIDILKDADIALVASYGKIIPAEFLTLPRYGFINWHPSLLPLYRGATPVQTALANGENITGLTWIQMADGIDNGDIIYQKLIQIKDDDNFESIIEKAIMIGIQSLPAILEQFQNSKIIYTQQDETKATFTKLLTKKDGIIDLSRTSVSKLFNIFNAYSYFPRIKVNIQEYGLVRLDKITQSIINSNSRVGTISKENNNSFITCSDNKAIQINQITDSNGKVYKF
jgi:methionyl-tRNA formyltransferase